MIRTITLCSIATLLLSMAAFAQQVIPVPSASHPTIQSAIAAANPGDTIQIAAGTYAGGIVIDKSLTLEGAGQGQTIIDAALQSRCLQINATQGDLVVLRDLSLARGAITAGPNNVTIGGCVRFLATPIGAIATLRIEDATIEDGQTKEGAGIYAGLDTKLELLRCRFEGNGISGPLPMNATGSNGGAVATSGDLEARDCMFVDNVVAGSTGQAGVNGGYGGAIMVSWETQALIEDCVFENNQAVRAAAIFGRGVFSSNMNLRVSRCRFLDNQAQFGPAVILVEGAVPPLVSLDNCLFHDNQAAGHWNKVAEIRAAVLRVNSCTMAGNDPGQTTQALIHLAADAHLEIRNTIISNNGSDHVSTALTPMATTDVSHSLLGNSSLSGVGAGPGMIEGIDAGFRDLAAADFRLLASSPAVNSGLAAAGDGPLDLAGQARDQLGAPDLGCFELAVGAEDPGPFWTGSVTDGTGSLLDLLKVDGSAGDSGRRAFTALGTTMTIGVDAAPGQLSSPFIIWGRVGLPMSIEAFSIPFAQGAMAFAPHLVATGNLSLFTLASSLGVGIIQSSPAPWQITGATLPYPLTITIQGLIDVGGGQVRVTNAIAVHNH